MEIFAGGRRLGTAKLLLKPQAGSLMKVEQQAAGASFAGFLRGVELGFGCGDAELLGYGADSLRKGDVLNLLDESEDVAGDSAAEAVEELASGVDGKRRRLFAMERTKSRVVLRASFAQFDVFANDANDVSLLLDGVCEVSGVGHTTSLPQCRTTREGLLHYSVEKL